MPNTPFKEIAGQRFGRLVALERIRKEKNGKLKTFWVCQCDCGKKVELRIDLLNENGAKSCGCIKDEKLRERVYKHGMANTPTYTVWEGIIGRCNNPKNYQYSYYGGRGIKVCERWLDFQNFFTDMSEKPEGLTIDRIDVNGDYCPENCRWVDMKTQSNNRRNNHLIECDGVIKTLQQWSDETGIHIATIDRRLELGWSIHDALHTPVKTQYRKKSLIDKAQASTAKIRTQRQVIL